MATTQLHQDVDIGRRKRESRPLSAPLLLAVAVIAATLGAAGTYATTRRPAPRTAALAPAPAPTPIGLKKYMVFLGDGTYDFAAAASAGNDTFERLVMGRSTEEIARNKAEAVAYYRERFGLDFSNGDAIAGVTLLGFQLPQLANYRAYTISGESVPSTGWEVRDGGWVAFVGPGGATLHGTWGGSRGRAVPEGAGMAFGDYSINVESPDGPPRAPIVMHYRANEPLLVSFETTPLVDCELTSPDFGPGRAYGISSMRLQPGGQIRQVVRNVLTF